MVNITNLNQFQFFRPIPAHLKMVKYFMSIRDDEAGAVIGKNGEAIKEIKELTGVSLVVENGSRSSAGSRIVKLEGAPRNVEFAKHLIKIRLQLHSSSKEKNTMDDQMVATRDKVDVQTAATVLAKYSVL